MKNIGSLFGNTHQLLEEVIILPVGVYDSGSTVYSLPAGYSWTDFEYIDFIGTVSNASDVSSGTTQLTKEAITLAPTNWEVQISLADNNSLAWARLHADNNHQFRIVGTTGIGRVQQVKGYRRRYATQNVSATINVNGGNPITMGDHFEIDIETALGADYLGKKLIVQAEIYNNTGQGKIDWFTVDWSGDITFSYGVDATVMGNSVMVTAGNTGLWRSVVNPDVPNTGVVAGIATAKCRVNVWKMDQFVTNTAGSGGGGKTTLYDGPAIGHGGTVPLNDDMTVYDDIRIQGVCSGVDSSATFAPEDIIGDAVWVAQCHTGDYIHTNSATTASSIAVTAVGAGNGITKVIGINYSS